MMIKIVLIVVIAVLAVFLALGIRSFRKLGKAVDALDDQRDQLFGDMERRADLVGELVEVTEDYSQYAEGARNKIDELRDTVYNGEDDNVANQADLYLDAVASFLFQQAEDISGVTEDHRYQTLKQDLVKAAEEISDGRTRHNEDIRAYNQLASKFPNAMFRTLFGQRPPELLEEKFGEDQTA